MCCYLDDMCFDFMEIGENVTISYGVYFACHGKNQGHHKITIQDGAYIGMRASVIARTDVEIGKNAIIGAQTLVKEVFRPITLLLVFLAVFYLTKINLK